MKLLRVLSFCLIASTARALEVEDFFDRLDNTLTIAAFEDNLRARLSGTIDLEAYHFQQPAPGLIDSKIDNLFNPRLTFFLDAQAGSQIYFFAQSRVDRGFDPSARGAQVRLDEYALRFTPWDDGRFNLQVGKFATVVGNFVKRHLSWENPFVDAPLVYENITPINDKEAPDSPLDFVRRFEPASKYEFNPVIWGPSYASGISISGRLGRFDYAAEMKNASLSSRPESWNVTETDFDHPTFSGRVGFRPNQIWNFGLSASDGPYFRSEAEQTLPPGRSIGDYRELVLGQDVSFAWHHLQLWAEFYEARFEVPRVGDADTFAYYLEAKYKFTPQLFGALRWNQQLFDNVPDGTGGQLHWGQDLGRIDVAAGYRFTSHTQLKLQYSFQHETSGPRDDNHLVAAQLTVRF
ncbi:MAG: hypothetical protein DME66_05420 [Verrucomicrobia bacterium]|nr:MAG: hypothetical protein DME66_05420 [Verrucomicrobiota bacterium]